MKELPYKLPFPFGFLKSAVCTVQNAPLSTYHPTNVSHSSSAEPITVAATLQRMIQQISRPEAEYKLPVPRKWQTPCRDAQAKPESVITKARKEDFCQKLSFLVFKRPENNENRQIPMKKN